MRPPIPQSPAGGIDVRTDEATVEPPRDPAGVLRVIACGSVDDGKSTLIGRLLHDAKAIHMDQLEAVRTASAVRSPGKLDLSLLTDGLRAERAQGITIDVAYRFFATPRRRFILADTPGHAHYTRNMVTGASTADAAMIVLDARNGVMEQTRRHACIAALLGVPRLFVCVNKMDLVEFEQGRFEQIRDDFLRFASYARPDAGAPLADRMTVSILPISALCGDNVVGRSQRMPWFEGASLLDQLDACPDRPSLEQSSA
jgi:bifunctional enzyme CysN/CysC